MDCSLPGSSVHGIFQVRVLEWVSISFSRRSSKPRDWTQVSHIAGRCFTIWATREVHKESQTYKTSIHLGVSWWEILKTCNDESFMSRTGLWHYETGLGLFSSCTLSCTLVGRAPDLPISVPFQMPATKCLETQQVHATTATFPSSNGLPLCPTRETEPFFREMCDDWEIR